VVPIGHGWPSCTPLAIHGKKCASVEERNLHLMGYDSIDCGWEATACDG
jgi:hypothetical protein